MTKAKATMTPPPDSPAPDNDRAKKLLLEIFQLIERYVADRTRHLQAEIVKLTGKIGDLTKENKHLREQSPDVADRPTKKNGGKRKGRKQKKKE